MISAPPPPSIVSAPEPPVRTLTPAEPVIETSAVSDDASTFWKFATLTISPVVWSALARLTVTALRRTSVLDPVPPSIEISAPRYVTVSSPAPAPLMSAPPAPSITSLPDPPVKTFAPLFPMSVLFPVAEPIRLLIPISESPFAKPSLPTPVVRLTLTPSVEPL